MWETASDLPATDFNENHFQDGKDEKLGFKVLCKLIHTIQHTVLAVSQMDIQVQALLEEERNAQMIVREARQQRDQIMRDVEASVSAEIQSYAEKREGKLRELEAQVESEIEQIRQSVEEKTDRELQEFSDTFDEKKNRVAELLVNAVITIHRPTESPQ